MQSVLQVLYDNPASIETGNPSVLAMVDAAMAIRILSQSREAHLAVEPILAAIREGYTMEDGGLSEYTDPGLSVREMFAHFRIGEREKVERCFSPEELDAIEQPARRQMHHLGLMSGPNPQLLQQRNKELPTARRALSHLLMIPLLTGEYACPRGVWCSGVSGDTVVMRLVRPEKPHDHYRIIFPGSRTTAALLGEAPALQKV